MRVTIERLPEGDPDRARGYRWLLSYCGYEQEGARSWTTRSREHAVSGAKLLAVIFLCQAWECARGVETLVFDPTPAAVSDFNRDPARHLIWQELQLRAKRAEAAGGAEPREEVGAW